MTGVAPEIEWEKTFDNHFSIRETSDGGYIVIGDIENKNVPSKFPITKIYLRKTDAKGNKIWERIVDAYDRSECRSVQQTYDGGYIVTGMSTWSGEPGGVLLFKTDANGNQQWKKHFGGGGTGFGEEGKCVQQTKDGGYLVAGCIQMLYSNYTNMYILKTDADGNKIWDKTLGECECYSAQQTVDGGFLVEGRTGSSLYAFNYLVKLSSESP